MTAQMNQVQTSPAQTDMTQTNKMISAQMKNSLQTTKNQKHSKNPRNPPQTTTTPTMTMTMTMT